MTDFSILIQEWYRLNKRDLPWRDSNSAYYIWLSEIILQQTQVKQGLSYYLKFVEKYPRISDLASASEDDVLKLWQGLGYYSRGRNLLFAAKQVIADFNGVFPDNYNDIIKLKGVGDYTASAISSIAFNLSHAVVDGNVYRVLSRCFLIDIPINSSEGKKEFKTLAESLIDSKKPGDHNQGLMEIGALVCKPKKPDCHNCPLQTKCLSFTKGSMLNYPVKLKKNKIKTRYFNYNIITNNTHIVIKQRKKGDIWQGLFDFPLYETSHKLQSNEKSYLDKEIKHILTHQHIFASFWIREVKEFNLVKDEKLIKITDLKNHALPQLLVKYINQSDYFNR